MTFSKRDRDRPVKSDAQLLLDRESMAECAAVSAVNPDDEWVYSKPLQCLRVYVLREYLYHEFKCLDNNPTNNHTLINSQTPVLPFQYDLERVIDDFVFLCFFVGNDFLPHLPSLDIRDGALDFLMQYRHLKPKEKNNNESRKKERERERELVFK